MSEPVDREVTLMLGDMKVKGKVRLTSSDQVIPPSAPDAFLTIAEVTLFEQGGKQILLRQLRVRRSAVTAYYFEDDVHARR